MRKVKKKNKVVFSSVQTNLICGTEYRRDRRRKMQWQPHKQKRAEQKKKARKEEDQR